MSYRKLSVEEIDSLLSSFHALVVPFVLERGFSCHQLFNYSREFNAEFYSVVSGLWSCRFGREYLRSWFRFHRPYKNKRGV